MQKRADGGFGWPQAAQAAGSPAPQLMQNLAAAGFSTPHDGQLMVINPCHQDGRADGPSIRPLAAAFNGLPWRSPWRLEAGTLGGRGGGVRARITAPTTISAVLAAQAGV